MSKDSFSYFTDQNLWFDIFGQVKYEESCPLQALPFNLDPFKVEDDLKKQSSLSPTICGKESREDFCEIIPQHEDVQKNFYKRPYSSTLMDQEMCSHSSSNDVKNNEQEEQNLDGKSGYKKEKYAKQYIYSKNYRDKKKQQFRALEQENYYLKKKVQDLQIRIRQIQMENSRLKEYPNQKELSIEQLNKQFMQKITFISQKIQDNTVQTEEKQHPVVRKTALLQKQFIKGYEEHGFSGSRKKEVLEYHMNEMLEVVIRDSEKYLCMLCCKNPDDSFKIQMPEYKKINNAFFQIMDLNEEDMQRVKEYLSFVFPAMKEIKKQCSEMYKSYTKIIKSMDRLHNLLKTSYVKNIDLVVKRMKIESWFEYYKYNKLMRKLKDDWISFIKKDDDNELQYNQRCKRGYKKNKISQTVIAS